MTSKYREALEIFEEFKNIILENVIMLDTDLQRLNIIKKALLKAQENEKILEIIKKKDVLIYAIKECEKVDKYNEYVIKLFDFKLDKLLTQEEFELLKEVLGNE